MQAGSIDLTTRSRIKEFGRIRRLERDARMFLVGSGEGEMLEMLGTYVGEEIDGSHYTSLADSIEVEHVDDLLALPQVTREVTLECIGNHPGGTLISSAPFTGVPSIAVRCSSCACTSSKAAPSWSSSC